MIRSRLAILIWSALVIGVVWLSAGWVVGALFVGAYLATAPGYAACRLLGVPHERDWIPVLATSLAIDVLSTEIMVYAHIWTPARAIVVLAGLTTVFVVVDERLSRS
jgi:hypothetical protein